MSKQQKPKKNLKFYRVGISLIITSLIFWIAPLIVPFLPLTGQLKAMIISGAIIIAEILFWIGAILAGKEVAMKVRSYLNPRNWRRRHVNNGENE